MEHDLHRFLEAANLLGYKDALLEQGADDLQQLKDLCDGEFRQLCEMVGMDTKPFHMMRLRKALDKHSFEGNPPPPLPPAPTDSSNTATVFATPTTPAPSPHTSQSPSFSGVPPTSMHSNTGRDTSTSSGRREGDSPGGTDAASVSTHRLSPPPLEINTLFEGKLFLPPYLQPGSECRSFDDLIDGETPIQRELGPCPFTAKVWDDKRKQIIQKYSIIYGKNTERRQSELSDFEENINEAAFQLCLRDPTLLVRRDELYVLSKRAITEGGYPYHHGFSKGKKCENSLAASASDKKRSVDERDDDSSSSVEGGTKSMKLDKLISESMTKLHRPITAPMRLSESKRKQKMAEVGMKISTNKLHQSSKLAALEKAHEQGDHGTAYHIQMELEALGTECMTLQAEYTLLKKKQRRSERYYNLKERHSWEQLQHFDQNDTNGGGQTEDCSIPSESNLTQQVVEIMHTPTSDSIPHFDPTSKAALLSTAFIGSHQLRGGGGRKAPGPSTSQSGVGDSRQVKKAHTPISPIRKRPTVTATILQKPAPVAGQNDVKQAATGVSTQASSSSSSQSPSQYATAATLQQQVRNEGRGGGGGGGRDKGSSSAAVSSDNNMHTISMIEDLQKQVKWGLK